jgi:hypothetical protein
MKEKVRNAAKKTTIREKFNRFLKINKIEIGIE